MVRGEPRVSADPSVGLLGLLLGGFILTVSAAIRAIKSNPVFDSHEEFEPDSGLAFPRRIDWGPLLACDPTFSPIVFEEFVHRLYMRAHVARGDAQALALLSPYLSSEARKSLASRELTGVRISNVTIGSMQVTSLHVGAEVTRIDLRFWSNVSAEDASWYLVEEWQLARHSGVQSKSPDSMCVLSCPNCGAPFESTVEPHCRYCCELVDGGRFDWFVIGMRLREARWRPPDLLRCTPPAETELPTMVSPSFAEQWAKLLVDDPKLEREALLARLRVIYDRVNMAWAARDLEIARPYLTDAIHDHLSYWLDAYHRQGLINCQEDVEIEQIELVKLQRDAWFDVLTVRIFARGLDYTTREIDDWIVAGSTTTRRRYSEYWTLIRGANVRGAAQSERVCPSCEAPLVIDICGSCEHCFAHVTRGEFDWVLSHVEPDETYLG